MLSIHLFNYFFDNHPFLDVGQHVRASWLLIKNNTVKICKTPNKKTTPWTLFSFGLQAEGPLKDVSSVCLSIAIAVTHGHPNESHPFDEHPCAKWRRLTTCQMFVPGCETMGTQLKSERKPSQTSDTTNLEKDGLSESNHGHSWSFSRYCEGPMIFSPMQHVHHSAIFIRPDGIAFGNCQWNLLAVTPPCFSNPWTNLDDMKQDCFVNHSTSKRSMYKRSYRSGTKNLWTHDTCTCLCQWAGGTWTLAASGHLSFSVAALCASYSSLQLSSWI